MRLSNDVFCDPDRGAHSPVTIGGWHGKRTGFGFVACGTGTKPSQHVGDRQCAGSEKTATFCGIIVIMSTSAGMLYGFNAT